MNLAIPTATLVGFCAALVRTTAWIAICPPFNAPWVPKRVRVGLATAIAFVSARHLGNVVSGLAAGEFVLALLVQALAGLVLGFGVFMMFSAIQAAGDMIDLQVGFSIAAVFDPLSGVSASPIARLHQMLALVMLFALNGHVRVVQGYLRSVEAVPSGFVDLNALGAEMLRLLGTFMVATLEIAFPVLAALFCAEIALGLLGKAAPQLNIMVLGFGVKAVVAFTLLGVTLVLLPEATNSVIAQGMRGVARAFGGG